MRVVDPEEFGQVHLHTHEGYLAVLQRLRPRTAFIEFAIHPQDEPNGLADLLADWITHTRVGVPPRPGYPKPSPTANLLTVRAHRDVFAILRSYAGFFRFVPGSPEHRFGDRTEFTDFGNVDVVFRDKIGTIIFWTVTHEGLAHMHPEV